MSFFIKQAQDLINTYKHILSRQLSTFEKKQKLISLKINRSELKHENELTIFYKLIEIQKDLDVWLKTAEYTASLHSGAFKYKEHLNDFLKHYQIKNYQLVHNKQQSACALLKLLQFTQNFYKDNERERKEIKECADYLLQFGSKEQLDVYLKSLNRNLNKSDMIQKLMQQYNTQAAI